MSLLDPPPEDPRRPGSPPPGSPDQPIPGQVSPEAKEKHRESILGTERKIKEDESSRHDELRINMMRSVVTEPLLTHVQAAAPGASFDVIVVLNEQYQGGLSEAWKLAEDRAKAWV